MNYKKLNNIIGWLVFAIATFVYVSTIEPTASFWDCGEYIACANGLEVGHPPGAPFFLLIGRFFILFAGGDIQKAAYWVNVMSALCSSFTILFLFWSITRLARKIIGGAIEELSQGNILAILGAGTIGALAYTFSDSFWFSAVEGEVYAMSSFFTAIVFWAILKWEEEDTPDNRVGALRWIILIAYLMGLSIGVHLLNLLVIPAICYIFYFKRYKADLKGFIICGVVSILILGGIQGGIIPGIAKLAADYELFFANSMGMGFTTGTVVFFLFLLGAITSTIVYTVNRKKTYLYLAIALTALLAIFGFASAYFPGGMFMRILIIGGAALALYLLREKFVALSTISLSFAALLIGYSTFFVLVIRSQANPPMDENNPENAVTLLSYLQRKQYGDWPIGYGQYYNAPVDGYIDDEPTYAKDPANGNYKMVDDGKNAIPKYKEEYCTIFPRMWSQSHGGQYKDWAGINDGEGVPTGDTDESGNPILVPTMGANLHYFFNHQIRYMYWRYFAWNFIGRQNDVQGMNDNPLEGNWHSGIKSYDESAYGADYSYTPHPLRNNKGTNHFFFIPFILGLLGAVYHFIKNTKDFFVVLCLFFFTGLAIVMYLNQYPNQPRERDYAYAASFYAFGIWIGLGVLGLFALLNKLVKNNKVATASLATLLSVSVPYLMAAEGWDDHDRSLRTMSRDFAINYLNSCAENAIIFTNGDNDTFPLWYAQEVEHIRTDVRVVNLSLLQTDWYIDQMRRKAYKSEAVPFTLKPDMYANEKNNVVILDNSGKLGAVKAQELMNIVNTDNPDYKKQAGAGEYYTYLPTSQVALPVDSMKVVTNGTVDKSMAGRIVKNVIWDVKKPYLYKNDLMVLDLIAGFNWDRPIYFAVTAGADAYLNLDEYLQLEGLAYRLVPIKSSKEEMQGGVRISTDIMYNNIMNKFVWGGMNKPGVNLDENSLRFSDNMRMQVGSLATALAREGKKDKAIKVLDKAMAEMPEENVPYGVTMYSIIQGYYDAGAIAKANELSQKVFGYMEEDLNYYTTNPKMMNYQKAFSNEVRRMQSVIYQLTMLASPVGNNQPTLFNDYYKRAGKYIAGEELDKLKGIALPPPAIKP